MASCRPVSRRSQPILLGVLAIGAMAGSAALIATSGLVRAPEREAVVPAIPGVTVDDDRGTAMPVVTSLRSNCRAERLGLRVGDHIDGVNGIAVRTASDLRRAIADDRAGDAVALHVRRGGALWTVSIDANEPKARGMEHHGPQDTAG